MQILHLVSKNKNSLSRGKRKGFTLVELLVVLVIIAILMAAIIPSMLGFIDKAKHEAIMAECRNAHTATMVVFNENYAKGKYAWMVNASESENFKPEDIAAANRIGDHAAIGGEIKSVEIMTDQQKRLFVYTINYRASNGVEYQYPADIITHQGEWTVYYPPILP